MINARNNHVRLLGKESGHGKVNTVRRGTGHVIATVLGPRHTQRGVERQRVAGPALVGFRSHDDRVAEPVHGGNQREQAACLVAIIIA